VIQSCQHNVFARFFDFPGQKHFVQDGVHLPKFTDEFSSVTPLCAYLIKVEYQIQLAHISKESIQYFHKEMNGFQIGQFIIVGIDAYTEE
jgi:hypothetical protein